MPIFPCSTATTCPHGFRGPRHLSDLLQRVEVGQISGSGLLEATLTTGFVFSLVAFVLMGSVGLGKKGLRDISGKWAIREQ